MEDNNLRVPSNKFTIKNTGEAPISYTLDSRGFVIGCTISKESGPFKNVYVVDDNGILDKYISLRQYTTSHNEVVESHTLLLEDKVIFKNFQISKDSLLLTDNQIDYQIGNISIDGLYTNQFRQDYFEAFKFVIKYYDVKKIEYIPYRSNSKWSKTNRYSSTDRKIEAYERFLNEQGKYTSPDDKSEIRTAIDSLSKCLEREKYLTDCKHQYQDLYSQIKNLTNIPDIKIDKNTESKIQSKDYYTIKYQAHILLNYPRKLFLEYDYSPSDFTFSGYNKNMSKSQTPASALSPCYQDKNLEDYETSLLKVKEYIDFLELRNHHKDSIIHANKLVCNIFENIDKLESLYVSVSYPGRLVGEAEVKITKSKIYDPFYQIMQNLLQQIKSATSFKQVYNYVEQINDLCEFLPIIYNSKTKDLEKELKGISLVTEQYTIFEKYMNK